MHYAASLPSCCSSSPTWSLPLPCGSIRPSAMREDSVAGTQLVAMLFCQLRRAVLCGRSWAACEGSCNTQRGELLNYPWRSLWGTGQDRRPNVRRWPTPTSTGPCNCFRVFEALYERCVADATQQGRRNLPQVKAA